MCKTSKDISLNFEKAIREKQDDLRYLVKKGKVSKRFIAKQNRLLKNLITYYHHTQEKIDFLKSELIHTQKANIRHREKLTDRIIQFEAICILHGIMDFPRFLNMPKSTLIHWAEDMHKNKGFMCTDMMKNFIADLPSEKGKLLESILFDRVDQEIKKLLQKINIKRNTHGN